MAVSLIYKCYAWGNVVGLPVGTVGNECCTDCHMGFHLRPICRDGNYIGGYAKYLVCCGAGNICLKERVS